MVGIPTSDKITKNAFCQEKMGSQEFYLCRRFWPWERKQIGQDFLIFGSTSDSTILAFIRTNYLESPRDSQDLVWQL